MSLVIATEARSGDLTIAISRKHNAELQNPEGKALQIRSVKLYLTHGALSLEMSSITRIDMLEGQHVNHDTREVYA